MVKIIFFDDLSNEIEVHYANWSSEVNVIINSGLEQGYEVWARKVKGNERELDKDK